MTSARAARIVQLEPQTCPRRMGEMGPWKYEENLDSWDLGRWAVTQEQADAEVAEFMANAGPGSSIGHVLWSYGDEQPRTCSFCGGIHPEDAIALVKAGWEVSSTTKGYKRYLEPPGARAHHEAAMSALRARETLPQPQHLSPVPPVKVYVQHFSEDQIRRFNEALHV